MGKSLENTQNSWSPTPAVGKSLKWGPLHSPEYLFMLLGVLEHLFGVLKALKSLKNGQNAHFSTFRAQ